MMEQSEEILRSCEYNIKSLDIKDVLFSILPFVYCRKKDIEGYGRDFTRLFRNSSLTFDRIISNTFQY